MASIAINGLGRVSRAALKVLQQADGAEVVAVNDLVPADSLAYLLRYDTVVSADIIGDPRASVVDATMTRVVDQALVKVMSWYDNEQGFSCQMIREAFTVLSLPAPDLSQIRP